MLRERISSSPATVLSALAAIIVAAIFMQSPVNAQDSSFHDAPASAAKMKNPYKSQAAAAQAGANLYQQKCKKCHGEVGKGTGNIPALASGAAQSAPDGEFSGSSRRAIRATACLRGPHSPRSSAGNLSPT